MSLDECQLPQKLVPGETLLSISFQSIPLFLGNLGWGNYSVIVLCVILCQWVLLNEKITMTQILNFHVETSTQFLYSVKPSIHIYLYGIMPPIFS